MLTCSAFVVAGAVAFWLFDRGYLRFNYPSHDRFPIRGLDVSHHQGNINWAVVKSQQVRFAYIKATEGGDYSDGKFADNWSAAKAAGIKVGAYHFFTFCRTGREQAANFLRTAPFDKDSLPMVLDLEFGGNCGKSLSALELGHEVADFVTEVTHAGYGEPIFYVTPEFFEAYLRNDSSEFPAHDLWLRNIFFEPRQAHCENWKIWQFANRGRVQGIPGAVDLNVFCGTESDFSAAFGEISK